MPEIVKKEFMIQTIYIIILIYFALGGVGFYLINKNKDPEIARKSYTKFGFYFIIITVLYFSITIQPLVFQYLIILIILIGYIELSFLFGKSDFKHIFFFILSVIVYSAFSYCFFFLGSLQKELILFTFLILSIFDSFSQIAGQLWGRNKILPYISPGKTWEGLLGGIFISLISAFLLKSLFTGSVPELIFFTTGTLFFAFIGDMLSSLYKRKYKVKDFNNIIPGHGGFLDRFDSLIAGGAWSVIYFQLMAS